MGMKRRWRFVAPFGAAVLVAASLLNFAPIAGAQSAGQPVEGLKGFATGQDVHATALDGNPQTGMRPINADEAWSGAAVDAGASGLSGAKFDEEDRIFQPSKAGKLTYARGSGLEVGLGTNPTDPNTIIVDALAEAAAPPPSKQDKDLLGPTTIPGLAYASALRGTAIANGNESGLVPDVCVVGDDLSRGLGLAADAQLIDTGTGSGPGGTLNTPLVATDAPQPPNTEAVAQTISHEFLVPNGTPNGFGLASEVREEIAPVSILANEASGAKTLTIEVAGEWVLRAVAGGEPGTASIHYGKGTVSPQTAIVSVNGNPVITAQQLLNSNKGLNVPIDPLINISVGEAPRAIAKPGTLPVFGSNPTATANGTTASAAVDVVRVYSQALGIDVRLGHMEVSASAPVGGVKCPIPVTKTADPSSINIRSTPDTSHITITAHNTYDCDLTNVVLTDHITKKPVADAGDPDFQLTAANPTPDSPAIPTGTIKVADVKWSLGTIPKGGTKSVTLDLKSATSAGIIEDIATAGGKLANCTGGAQIGVAVNGLSIANLSLAGSSVPVDVLVAGEIPRTGAEAKNTIAAGAGLIGLALAGGIAMRRRRRAPGTI